MIAGDTIRGHSFAAGDAVNVAQRLEAAAERGRDPDRRRDLPARARRRPRRVGRAAGAEGTGRRRSRRTACSRCCRACSRTRAASTRRWSAAAGSCSRSPTRSSAPSPSAPATCSPCSELRASASRGSSGRRSAGIGDRARLLVGTCLPYGEGITFWPALEVVKQGTGIDDGDSAEQALAKIEATLGDDEAASLAAKRVAALVGLEETGETAEQGFWGFRKLAEALARERPTVIVFDDVNWGEPHFLDLVEYLAESVRDAPLLDRRHGPAGAARAAAGVGRRQAERDVDLPRAAVRAASRASCSRTCSPSTPDEDLVARIQSSAEGNPLFVEEMVSMLIDGGYLGGTETARPPASTSCPCPRRSRCCSPRGSTS